MEKRREETSQFKLLGKRRFAPFFWTQFLGAFNDNVFKNALLALVAFNAAYSTNIGTSAIDNLAAGFFILPFVIFSALAGQLADKYEKSALIRYIKLFEIFTMLTASVAFYYNSVWGLLIILFFLGTQSAFFGPVKYSIIPQHLRPDELVEGNAWVESGTFIAILLGTITGALLTKVDNGPHWIAIVVVLIAITGWLTSRRIPPAKSVNETLRIRYNPFTETWKTLQLGRQKRTVFLAIIGISWFWFLGASYLTQLFEFTKIDLNGNQTVVTTLLSLFSIGIALGALLCGRLSGHKVELGLVPIGSIGLTIFGVDIFFAYTPSPGKETGILGFLSITSNFRLLLDFLMIGVFGGLYTVPLYAMIQQRSDPKSLSRVIASLNIMNALFMTVAALLGILLLSVIGITIPQLFLLLALMNIVVALYIYTTIPEFTMRFLIWVITHTMYRVTTRNLDQIPDEGPAVLVCNHVSYMDALIIGGACRRPVRFVIHKPIYRLPVLNYIFRAGKTIPIDSQKTDPDTYNRAFKQISKDLEAGHLVCIFPEGKLTVDGMIDEFKTGIEKIISRNPVPVVPMALKGLWGSFFSHKDGRAIRTRPKRFWSRVELIADTPINPDQVTTHLLKAKVQSLLSRQQ